MSPQKRIAIILDLQEATYLNFFTFTTIIGESSQYTVFAPRDTLYRDFGVQPRRTYRKGDTIARGYIDIGDQVFVDKISYNFIHPGRGDVFVFKTYGIRRIEIGLPPGVQSQHYIKRLAGLPGDVLRINAPYLFVNGREGSEWVFERVMSGRNGYRGLSTCNNSPTSQHRRKRSKVPEQAIRARRQQLFFKGQSRFWGSSRAECDWQGLVRLLALQQALGSDSLKKMTPRRQRLNENPPFPDVSLTNVRVLVVDDEVDARELVKRMLEIAGATVSIAGSVSEAMECVLTARPDVLVCDLGMPGEDGYSLIRKLRMLEESREVPCPRLHSLHIRDLKIVREPLRSGFQNHLADTCPMDARPINSLTKAGEVAELIPGGMDVTPAAAGLGRRNGTFTVHLEPSLPI